MRKTTQKIALICALLLLSVSLFAVTFSGKVDSGIYYDLDNLSYGVQKNNTSGKLAIDFVTVTNRAKGNGKVYAEARGFLGCSFTDDGLSLFPGESTKTISLNSLSLSLRMDYARIIGPGWELGLLGIPYVPDYAKSPIDTIWNEGAGCVENATVSRVYNRMPGGYFKYHDYNVGVGFAGTDSALNYVVFFESPRYTFSDSALRFSAFASGKTAVADQKLSWGLSAKYGLAKDLFSVSAATDAGFVLKDNGQVALSLDASLSSYFDFFGVEGYYGTRARDSEGNDVLHLLSAKVLFDLDKFDLPMRVSFAAKDIAARKDLEVFAGWRLTDAFTLETTAAYALADNGRDGENIRQFASASDVTHRIKGTLGLSYSDSAVCDASLSLSVSKSDGEEAVLQGRASVKSRAIVDGCEIGLGWIGDDLTNVLPSATNGHLGKISFSCAIDF